MKLVIKLASILIFFYSCNILAPRKQALAKVDEFNSVLEQNAFSQRSNGLDSIQATNVIDTMPNQFEI